VFPDDAEGAEMGENAPEGVGEFRLSVLGFREKL
jgi:hypothetical protein